MREREEVKLQFASDDYEHMVNEIVRLRTALTTAERERDEARREREAMAAVVEAVSDYFNDAPNDNGLYSAWTAYTLATSNVRALDAAEGA